MSKPIIQDFSCQGIIQNFKIPDHSPLSSQWLCVCVSVYRVYSGSVIAVGDIYDSGSDDSWSTCGICNLHIKIYHSKFNSTPLGPDYYVSGSIDNG